MKGKKAMWLGLALGGLIGSGALVQAAYSGPKVEITYLHGFTGPDGPVMQALVKKFNDSHPNINVKAQAQPWGTTWAQLGSLVAAGKSPDVVVINEDQINRFVRLGAVTELTASDRKSSGLDTGRFYKSLVTPATQGSRTYGVPLSAVTLAMYYNKDLMKKMGVTKVPTNRDEFLKAATACTTDANGKHPGDAGFDAKNLNTWGGGMGSTNNFIPGLILQSIIYQNGGSLIGKDLNAAYGSQEAVDALQFMVDVQNKYAVAPSDSTENSEIAGFRQGKVCFNFQGIWMVSQYQGQQGLNFGVSPFPRLGTKKDAAWGGGSYLTLPRQRVGYDKNKRAAALEFVNWLTEPAQDLQWTSAGSLPTQPAVAKDKSFDNNPTAGVFKGLEAVTITSAAPWLGQVVGPLGTAAEAALTKKKDPKTAIMDAAAEANKQIAQARQNFR